MSSRVNIEVCEEGCFGYLGKGYFGELPGSGWRDKIKFEWIELCLYRQSTAQAPCDACEVALWNLFKSIFIKRYFLFF